MPATSGVAIKVGKEKPCFKTRERTFGTLTRSSKFTATICRPRAVSFDWCCRSSDNWSLQDDESVTQKLKIRKPFWKDRRSHCLPSMSCKENSGALKG